MIEYLLRTLERLMVVAYACECCCETGGCNNEFAFRRLHLGKFGFQAVGSSTSSGGDNKKSPQASMRCCSLWARALTLKAYLPMVPTGCCIVSGKACENQRSLAHGLRECLAHGLFSRVLFSLRAILIRMLSRAMMSWCDVVLEQIEAVVVSSGSSKKYQ
jgi:hypothetical protein